MSDNKIVSLHERLQYYRNKKSSQKREPIYREEFDALVEVLEIVAEELYKTQSSLSRVTRILIAAAAEEPPSK